MSAGSRPAARFSRRKKIWFSLAAVVVALAAIELISWLAIRFVERESSSSLRLVQENLAAGGARVDNAAESIHPYCGWVLNPHVNQGSEFLGRHVPVNELGFNDEDHGIPKRNAGKLIVGIAGGSVAWQMSVAGEATLVRALREDPRFRNREIEIVRLAMSAYKQPQQLMQLNFLLALGAEFDVIVNLDGYDEMALAICENYESGVFVAYPRMWHVRLQDIVDPRIYSLSCRLLRIRATRQQLAVDRLNSWLSWSSTLNFIWYVRNQRLQQELVELVEEQRRWKYSDGSGFAALGPAQLTPGETGAYDDAAAVWKNCSQQMHRLCRANRIAYLHCLQPSQYFPGSKPMGQIERAAALIDGQKCGMAIAKGYPLLVSQGAVLQNEGTAFHDLTMLFSKTEEQIYVDQSSQYNQRGNDLLAEAVAERIIEAVNSLAAK